MFKSKVVLFSVIEATSSKDASLRALQTPLEKRVDIDDGYPSFEDAKSKITDHILEYYSRFRSHAYNNGLTPVMKEENYWDAQSLVATFT